jgi:hypothetical protein
MAGDGRQPRRGQLGTGLPRSRLGARRGREAGPLPDVAAKGRLVDRLTHAVSHHISLFVINHDESNGFS